MGVGFTMLHNSQQHTHRFAFALSQTPHDTYPIPLLMSDPTAYLGVVRPLWIYPESKEYQLHTITDATLLQITRFVQQEIRNDALGRLLAPYYDSIQQFLADAQLHLDRSSIIHEIDQHPEILRAIAQIFTTRAVIQQRQ
jgi:hypothetical protein